MTRTHTCGHGENYGCNLEPKPSVKPLLRPLAKHRNHEFTLLRDILNLVGSVEAEEGGGALGNHRAAAQVFMGGDPRSDAARPSSRNLPLKRLVDVMFGATVMYATLIVTGLSVHTVSDKVSGNGIVPLVGRTDSEEAATPEEMRGVLDSIRPGGRGSAQADSSEESSSKNDYVHQDMLLEHGMTSQSSFVTPTGPSACPEPPEALHIDDIAFGVLTSERFLDTRLASQRRTWLRSVRHVVFYSETVVANLPTVALSPPENEQLVGGGAWKNFPALMDLHRRYPTKKWVFFNDDDTCVSCLHRR